MMVSDKMIQKFTNLLWGYLGKTTNEKNRVEITQQIVNAAWTEFDPDDEKTWPKEEKHYYVNLKDPDTLGTKDIVLHWWHNNDHTLLWPLAIRYADPQDLMFNKEV